MLHTPSPGNLVLPLLGQFLLLRNIEVHGAMSETGASQPLNLFKEENDHFQYEILRCSPIHITPYLNNTNH